MKIFLSILFTIFSFGIFAQTTTYERMSESVRMSDLMGKWKSIDSTKNEIEFRLSNGSFFLGESYHFKMKDSNLVCAVGVLMRWPPAYCYLRFTEKGNLEIEFSGVADANPLVYTYQRVE